jgi:hypothetical protein
MNRRGFLGVILASAAAPAIVRASSLMNLPVRAPSARLGGGDLADDTLQSYSETITINQMRGAEAFGLTDAQMLAWSQGMWRDALDNIAMRALADGVYDKPRLIQIQSRNFVRLDGALS